MNIEGVNDNFFLFVSKYSGTDGKSLMLANAGKNLDFDLKLAVLQIECRKKNANKLPSFTSDENLLFPTSLSSEQCTSEVLADFHASLLKGGESLIDMSAGLCIDSFAFSKRCSDITAIEIDPFVSKVAAYNAGRLGLANFTAINSDSIEYLKETRKKFDVIFIDPARRKADSGRAYSFDDCTPDITACLDLLRSSAPRIIIKASPMLDLRSVSRQIPGVTDIFVTSLAGECKEIIVDITSDSASLNTSARYNVIDFAHDGKCNYRFTIDDTDENIGESGKIFTKEPEKGDYLYIPDAGIMKLRPWKIIRENFPLLEKLHANSHIFFGQGRYEGFPGRRFVIKEINSAKDKSIKSLKGTKMNVLSRNYPLSAPELAKKLKVKDGGTDYILGTTFYNGSHRLIRMVKD